MVYSCLSCFHGRERKQSIDKNLPFAVTFMYALSRADERYRYFKSISRSEDTYERLPGIDVVLRDMDYFGSDLKSALHNLCEITPSEKLKISCIIFLRSLTRWKYLCVLQG